MDGKHIKSIEIIDWYDGLIQAVISTSWQEGMFLASIIAYDLESDHRIFALLPMAQEHLDVIRGLTADSDGLLEYLQALWREPLGEAMLVRERHYEVLALRAVPASKLRAHVVFFVEDAIQEDRMHWFDDLEVAGAP